MNRQIRGFPSATRNSVCETTAKPATSNIGKVIFEDYSAKTFLRPEWTKLIQELKRTKGKNCDYIMFTKWDRFTRNTMDGYNVINQLMGFGIIPMAIEKPLDLAIPEQKLMLAIYLSMPEVENDRRGLNVKYGMRCGRKEGRWMGMALPGYKNRTREDGSKYIALNQPEAEHGYSGDIVQNIHVLYKFSGLIELSSNFTLLSWNTTIR